MTHFRGLWTLTLFLLLLCSWEISAQTWQSDDYHLSMETPTDWQPMSKGLLAQTNAQVSHVTGRGFISGCALNHADALVFPYMLVQFKPYTAMPEQYRPKVKLDERDKLELICEIASTFRQHGPLPSTIDTPQFIDRFGNNLARLTRLDDDGRFDFTGKIPHQVSQDPIRYHTHGVIGKDGVAMVSVFTIEDFTGLTHIIQNEMRTLAFEQGYTGDALPDKPAVPEASANPGAVPPSSEAEQNDQSEQPAPQPADSTPLIIILSLMGMLLVVAAMTTWFIAHRNAQVKRERRRERMQRRHANQSAAQVPQQPRPAQPPAAQSRGSNDRQRRGTTWS